MMFGKCRASDGKASTKKKNDDDEKAVRKKMTHKQKESKAKQKRKQWQHRKCSFRHDILWTHSHRRQKKVAEKKVGKIVDTQQNDSVRNENLCIEWRDEKVVSNGRYSTNVHILSPSVAGSASHTNTHTHTCGRWILCARGWSNQITYPFDSMVDVSLRLTLWCVPHLPSANEFEKQQRHRYPSPRISPPAHHHPPSSSPPSSHFTKK